MVSNTPNSGWEPEFTLDLESATAQRFQEVKTAFETSTRALGENVPPLPFQTNGWYDVTPEAAEAILRRNRPGTNREPTFATITYYWRQMRDGTWMPTGQPIILNVEGWLNDAQHRLWASYLGLATFKSYVIVDAPVIDQVFAYIDNGKSRTPAAALQTAKFNGLSSVIGQTIQIASNYDIGAYTCHMTKHVARMSPIQYLRYAETHPGIREAARMVLGDHKEAVELIGDKAFTTFFAYKVSTLYGEDVAERFFDELCFPDEMKTESLDALRIFLTKQAKTDKPLPKHLILAHLIVAFNAWIAGQTVKRVAIHTDDPFPKYAEAEQTVDGETEVID